MSTVPGELHEVQRPSTRVERVVRPGQLARRARGAAGPSRRPAGLGWDRPPARPRPLVGSAGDARRPHRDRRGARDRRRPTTSFVLAGGVTHNQIVADPRFRDALRCRWPRPVSRSGHRSCATGPRSPATWRPRARPTTRSAPSWRWGPRVVLSRLVGDTRRRPRGGGRRLLHRIPVDRLCAPTSSSPRSGCRSSRPASGGSG